MNRLQLVAECFRDAAFIYLHSILERLDSHYTPNITDITADPNPNSQTDGENHPPGLSPYLTEWAPLISTPKPIAVRRCLSRVESFPLDDHCEYSALTFPLFIAGCESDTLEQRDLVLRSLGKLQNNFGIGNVRRAKEVLGILWARKDATSQNQTGDMEASVRPVHWLDILEELQWELILA